MNKNFFLKKPYTYLRKKNKNNSEIVSQIIYGEKFKIIKKINNWFKIKNSYDRYKSEIKCIEFGKYLINNFQEIENIYQITKKAEEIYLNDNYKSF